MTKMQAQPVVDGHQIQLPHLVQDKLLQDFLYLQLGLLVKKVKLLLESYLQMLNLAFQDVLAGKIVFLGFQDVLAKG